MALWQYDFYLVPEAGMDRLGFSPGQILAGDSNGELEFGREDSLRSEYRTALGDIAPSAPRWAADWEVYGTEDGNRVDVLLNGGNVEQVRVRIDLRSLDPRFITGIVSFAKEMHCLLVSEELELLPASLETVYARLAAAVRARQGKGILDAGENGI